MLACVSHLLKRSVFPHDSNIRCAVSHAGHLFQQTTLHSYQGTAADTKTLPLALSLVPLLMRLIGLLMVSWPMRLLRVMMRVPAVVRAVAGCIVVTCAMTLTGTVVGAADGTISTLAGTTSGTPTGTTTNTDTSALPLQLSHWRAWRYCPLIIQLPCLTPLRRRLLLPPHRRLLARLLVHLLTLHLLR